MNDKTYSGCKQDKGELFDTSVTEHLPNTRVGLEESQSLPLLFLFVQVTALHLVLIDKKQYQEGGHNEYGTKEVHKHYETLKKQLRLLKLQAII